MKSLVSVTLAGGPPTASPLFQVWSSYYPPECAPDLQSSAAPGQQVLVAKIVQVPGHQHRILQSTNF